MHNDRVHKRGDDGRVSEVRRQRATFGNRTTDDSRCSRGKAPLKEKGVKIQTIRVRRCSGRKTGVGEGKVRRSNDPAGILAVGEAIS